MTRTYQASCHCAAIRFTFRSEEITSGRRCNCSICIRRGAVLSAGYVRAADVDVTEGREHLALYRFGGECVNHHFCRTCGITPFSTVAYLPPGYAGPARVGDYRVNLGCVHELDALALEIAVIDGKSL